jgi:ATP-dependent Lhr-like helicase
VLDALWDLVWAGEVTNDTFAPLRALRWKRPGAERRPRPGRLATLGPPEAAGRWSRVEAGGDAGEGAGRATALAAGGAAPSGATRRLHALALALLDRHGVLTREAVLAEGVEGGFAGIYPVLRALEEAGRIRRGYFVDGLGAAQFALAGAIDRLRGFRDPEVAASRVDLLAAADPAQPYGAALAWPHRDASERHPVQRAAGAYVALVDGAPVIYLERGGRGLVTFPAADDAGLLASALAALRMLVVDGRTRELVVRRVDGQPVGPASPWADRLAAGGFSAGYRGMVLRVPGASRADARARG